MAGVNADGFTIKPLEQIRTDLGNRLIARFGSTFNISPESPDGQLLGVYSDALFEAWQMGELSHNAFAPSKTFGVGLDNLCELNHVRRYFKRPTSATVQLTGVNGALIPTLTLLADDSGLEFYTVQDITLDDQTDNSVSVLATVSGPNEVLANTITVIVEPVAGLVSVTNPEAGITGIDREEDPQLRNRRAASVITTGTNTNEALYSALFKLGANYVVVVDNDEGVMVDGQPANTFQCIVEGGSQVEIAEAIFDKKPYGIQAYGDIVTVVTDSKGFPKNIGFSRTARVPIYVTVQFARKKGAAFDSEVQIAARVLEHINSLNINEDVVWSDIFEPITESVDFISIKSLTIGLSANPTLIDDLPMGIKQRASATDITVVIDDITP